MNKWIVLVVALTIVAGAQAKEKGKSTGALTQDRDAFIAAQQKKVEASGGEFDKAKAEEAFKKMDKNGDGVISADERAPTAMKGKKGK